MSYRTPSMGQQDTTQVFSNVSLKQHAELPHILRQSNHLAAGGMCTANVKFSVRPHAESAAAPMPTQRELHAELYPTQSSPSQPHCEHEHDWHKHAIVASVVGLKTKLAELDSEIRSGAPADVAGASVLRQVQDHASLLRDNAKQLAATHSKHKEVTALTHKICSQMHDNAQLQSTSLEACQDDISKLKTKQSSAVGLTVDICSELQKGLLEHGEHKQSLQRDVALLQQKDAVAQALLSKMLTMLDEHESVVLKTGKGFAEHDVLLDGLVAALENSKSKMQTFDKTQQDMQRVLADFKAGRMPASGAHDDEALQTKLDRYERMSRDLDAQCTHALQKHGAKMEELQRTHQQALHEQRMQILQLERAQQQAADEQQGRMQTLERKLCASQGEQRKIAELEGRVQELALLHLNSSQNASIARVTERDVKLMQHEIKQMHVLKKDVETMHEATNSSVSTMQADLRKMQIDSKTRNEHSIMLHRDVEQVKASVSGLGAADKSIAEVTSKVLDMRRDMTLQNIRIDKAATSIHDIQSKLAA
jgi:hypothetical protein